MAWHLAQLNVAKMLAPLDTPLMAEFVAALEPINSLADGSPGFIWRLQDDDGDATSIRVFDDDMMLVNMSVWASVEHLQGFVYRSGHATVMRRRKSWFEKHVAAYSVLWWVAAGHRPSVEEGRQRLERLRSDGPSSRAFSFAELFPPPA